MRTRHLLLAVVPFLAATAAPFPASALSCAGVDGWTSGTVVVGTVVEERDVTDRGADYRIAVDEVWRGEAPASVWFGYESIWSDPFPRVGTSYVVHLEDDLTVQNCSIAESAPSYVQEARPAVVRPPGRLGWVEDLWWQVRQAIRARTS